MVGVPREPIIPEHIYAMVDQDYNPADVGGRGATPHDLSVQRWFRLIYHKPVEQQIEMVKQILRESPRWQDFAQHGSYLAWVDQNLPAITAYHRNGYSEE